MQELIDILSFKLTETPLFLVNTSATAVDVTMPSGSVGDHHFRNLRNLLGNDVFPAGDAFRLLSVMAVLPESFVFANIHSGSTVLHNALNIGLQDATSIHAIPSLGLGGITVPAENYEYAINAFISPLLQPTPLLTTFGLWAEFINDGGNNIHPQVSMLGVPSALNGQTMYVKIMVKVAHTLPLVTSY